jgi:hypothetical protein
MQPRPSNTIWRVSEYLSGRVNVMAHRRAQAEREISPNAADGLARMTGTWPTLMQ